MKVLGFCVNDSKPFNSTRYYAHVSDTNAQVMHYTSKGYSNFLTVEFKKELDESSKYDMIRHQVTEKHYK